MRLPFLYSRNLECLIAIHADESISISFALRPLRAKSCTIPRWSIWRFFACLFDRTETLDNAAPYELISVNFQLLDSLFCKEYGYGSIISPFSTAEK
jgi:hypothetical protein